MIRLKLFVLAGFAYALPALAQQVRQIGGSWSGAYICNQGETALHLSVRSGEAGDHVVALFSFGPLKDNPNVSRGSYQMGGTFDPESGRLRLRGQAWIERPADYVMVDLDGMMRSSGLSISGNVRGPGCSHFELVRDQADLVG